MEGFALMQNVLMQPPQFEARREILAAAGLKAIGLREEQRILKTPSAKMEIPRFIQTGSAPECVSRPSSIG
jgi:hypothetical protein